MLGLVAVLGERHLRHLLLSYMIYYNEARMHLSLDKEATDSAPSSRCRPDLWRSCLLTCVRLRRYIDLQTRHEIQKFRAVAQ